MAVAFIEDAELFVSSAITIFDTRKDSEERKEWLKHRTNSIGGSEIGMIAGFSNYGSALTVYNEKLGLVDKFKGNIHTEYGTRMEPLIRDWVQDDFFRDTNIELQTFEYPFMMVDKEFNFFSANIDGLGSLKEEWIYRENKDTGEIWTIPKNEYFGLEIKTGSEFLKRMWEGDEVPSNYYLQCQWYMGITGLKYFLIIYLLGKEVKWKVIPRCNDDIKAIRDIGKDFWSNHIMTKIPPDVSGIKKETEQIIEQQTLKDELEVAISDDKLQKYNDISEQIKKLETEKEILKQNIFLEMENNKKGFSENGEFKISRFEVSKDKVDMKLLKEKYPVTYSEVLKGKTTFVNMKISKIKELCDGN